jgi:hypothetical protein
MRWVIVNSETEDVFERFAKDGTPCWSDRDDKAKWFKEWREITLSVSLLQKAGYDCYPVTLDTLIGKRK